MSVFGNYASAEIVDAAEKFIGKMDERELAVAIEQSERAMLPDARTLLVEAIFDAFRQRGESSQDAAEAAGTTLEALSVHQTDALNKLLAYARGNPGLLKDAAVELAEREPDVLAQISADIVGGIKDRLPAR
jgi:hypothetical protein